MTCVAVLTQNRIKSGFLFLFKDDVEVSRSLIFCGKYGSECAEGRGKAPEKAW